MTSRLGMVKTKILFYSEASFLTLSFVSLSFKGSHLCLSRSGMTSLISEIQYLSTVNFDAVTISFILYHGRIVYDPKGDGGREGNRVIYDPVKD